uniref:Uncharacterized protein n=1 Tax=Populus trichocarpa TaxID=3694 RepID=B9I3P8_POPTR
MKTKHLMHDQVNMICCCSLLLRSSLFLLSPSCCKDLLREADVGVLFDCCHLKMRLRLLDVQISRENKGHATATFTTCHGAAMTEVFELYVQLVQEDEWSLNEGQEGGFSPASMNLEAKVLSFQEDNVEINKHFLIFCGYEAGRCLLFVCLDG